jgi:hypothetical protein
LPFSSRAGEAPHDVAQKGFRRSECPAICISEVASLTALVDRKRGLLIPSSGRCRHFLPVTDDVIRWHLTGHDEARQPFVAGVYPMLLDETCFFLAVDFDKTGWLEDSAAFMETCAGGWICWPDWSDHVPDAAGTCGWSADRTSGSIRTTGFYRIKTRCRRVALAV